MMSEFQIAVDFFNQKDYVNAEKLLKECYKIDSKSYEIRYLFAIIKSRKGEFTEAVSWFKEALKLDDKNPETWYNLALAFQNLNMTDEAVENYKKALELNPFLAEAHNNLAIIYKNSGSFDLAEQEFMLAVKARPNNQNAVSNLGNLQVNKKDSKELKEVKELYSKREFEKALNLLEKMGNEKENSPEILNLLGMIHYSMNNIDLSMKCYERLIAADPVSELGFYSMAVCFQAKENLEQALVYYKKAIEIKPDYLDALNNLGLLLVNLKKFSEAEECYRKAIQIDPDYYNCITNLGALKVNTDFLQEAVELFDRALGLAQKNNDRIQLANAYGNIGFVKLRQLDFNNALKYFEMTLELDPDNLLAHYNRGETLLMMGRFSEGWKEYEWRTGRKDFGLRRFHKPLQAGSDIKNKRILVYAEQGIGDALQFVRYLPMLKTLGAYIIFECDKSILEIVRSIKEIDELLERDLVSAPNIEYDFEVPLLSLPLYFGTEVNNVPDKVPYLTPDPKKMDKWKKLIPPSDKIKIGIVWAGSPTHSNDRHRSVRLKQFLPLFSVPGVQFFSLQKGFPLIQLRDYQLFLNNLDDYIQSFSDTAAAINQLDLVIAVDTSVAHMAGALGKPVWLLLPFVPDWRWMLDRNDSPWYPSMKLYRQPRISDWNSVFVKIKNDLISLTTPGQKQMKNSERSYELLDKFLRKIESETYPEPVSRGHCEITAKVIDSLLPAIDLRKSAEILDIGCGQGPALKLFREKGFSPIGIALNEEDVKVCTEQGFQVYKMDQSFMNFENNRFDLIWSRHCIEHSFAPYFTLSEYSRVLRPGGFIYLEVPAPDTAAHHESNPNHYSVLTKSMWTALLQKCGLRILNQIDFPLVMLSGEDDVYWAFICQKELASASAGKQTSNLVLALTAGENFGWGICSKYLRNELSKRITIRDAEEIQHENGQKVVDGTVLHALSNYELYPLHNIRGERNFGYTFFESELTEKSVENAAKFDKVIGGSSYNRDKLLEKGIKNVDYLIQGIDPELFYPGEIERNPDLFVLFSGGKFELRKGQDLVLKAIGILQQKYPDIILINAWYNLWPETMDSMAGSKHISYERKGDNWQQFMVNLLKINGIDGNKVFTLPLTPNEKMREVYLRTDLGLFPNRCEGGTNLVLMEYMACGKPVVASFNSGHKDILTDENSLPLKQMYGFKVMGNDNNLIADWEEPDIDEIIAKIEYAYNNRGTAKTIGIKAGNDLKKLTWAASAERLLQIINKSS